MRSYDLNIKYNNIIISVYLELTKNVYFDQARISRVQSLTGFNFEFKQVSFISLQYL